jgi:hypothetical protein
MSVREVLMSKITWLGITAGVLLFALMGGSSDGKKSGSKAAPNAYEKVLDDHKPAIVDCVMEQAIQKGASAATISIKVLVNGKGQLFGSELSAKITPSGAKAAEKNLTDCVRTALGKLTFPSSKNSLTELRREWTFATK